MKIPVLPISWADAQPILAAMGGPVAPSAWRGSLALTYHLGPGAARVHLLVKSDWGQTRSTMCSRPSRAQIFRMNG